MEPDFPAAHSMDTEWFAVDRDGHVACFDSGTMGAVAAGATQEIGYETKARIEACLPPGPVVFDIEGHRVPGKKPKQPHVPRFSWLPLCFLKSLELVREEIAAGRAYEVRAATGVAVVFREFNHSLMTRLHEDGECLRCVSYDFARDDLPPESEDLFFLAARHGLFYCGHLWGDDVAGLHGREELPVNPAHVDQLPPDLRKAVGRVRFDKLS